MNELFSKTSDVTLVITSCNRFALLEQTLSTFFRHNSYPLREAILIEDSPHPEVINHIPESVRAGFRIIVNDPKIGQDASIDKAYREVKTPLIFHCEDDWVFYRSSFIEDSKAVLEAEPKCFCVWLRHFQADLHPFTQGKILQHGIQTAGNVAYRRLGFEAESGYGGVVSFNPGLRRLSDYPNGGYESLLKASDKARGLEKIATKHFMQKGFFSAILEEDAIVHTGFNHHISIFKSPKNFWKYIRDHVFRLLLILIAFFIGWWVG